MKNIFCSRKKQLKDIQIAIHSLTTIIVEKALYIILNKFTQMGYCRGSHSSDGCRYSIIVVNLSIKP